MKIRSLYRLSLTIEAILNDITDGDINEKEELEMLLDVKKLSDIFGKELDALIKQKAGMVEMAEATKG